ncbi:MAG: YfhO family protein [Bacteroidia bacterium]
MKWVANADSEIAALRNFDPKAVAIIDQRYKDALAGSALVNDLTSTITLDDYKPNHLTYTSQSAGDQLAVFSEIYYDKGWNAYIDGKLTPYVRANYVLRAMKIPSGNHKIEWKFEPEVIATGTKLSYAGSVLLFVFLGVSLFLEYRKTKEVKN